MTHLRSSILWLIAAGAFPALAQAPRWAPVPGAPEVLIDLRSVQFRGSTAQGWVKNLPGPWPSRSATLARFDCQARTLQVMASIGYDAQGRPVTSASLLGRPGPLPEDEAMGWVYDALCEGARSLP